VELPQPSVTLLYERLNAVQPMETQMSSHSMTASPAQLPGLIRFVLVNDRVCGTDAICTLRPSRNHDRARPRHCRSLRGLTLTSKAPSRLDRVFASDRAPASEVKTPIKTTASRMAESSA
jgi:hypothetical protein